MLMRVELPHHGKNTLYFQCPKRINVYEPLVKKPYTTNNLDNSRAKNDHQAPSGAGVSYMPGTGAQGKIKPSKT